MGKAYAVIGAGWGDEGKGHIVDFIASRHTNPVVIRYNGGCQAGHTVVVDKRRHVFHNFGSGVFANAQSVMGHATIVNPLDIVNEAVMLNQPYGSLHVHRDAQISLPCDALINQRLETSRGSKRNGSCGAGINECIRRGEGGYKLTYLELNNSDAERWLRKFVAEVNNEYVPARMAALGLSHECDQMKRLLSSCFTADVSYITDMLKYTQLICDYESAKVFDNNPTLIFEGAQGLQLSCDNSKDFPHLTPSYTGADNIITAIQDTAQVDELHVIYVTRAYATRHGNGPFPSERPELHYKDDTNQPNDYQGKLRFGILDLDALSNAINRDIRKFDTLSIRQSYSIAVTCLDQLEDKKCIKYIRKGIESTATSIKELFEVIASDLMLGCRVRYYSLGPAREDVYTYIKLD